MVAKIFKSSVNVKTAGSPQKFIGKHNIKVGERGLFCTVYGVANAVVKRADPKDPEKFYFGLKGTFEVLPADDGEAVGGAALFAPDAIHDKVVDQLKSGAAAVSFAFEAYVVGGGTAGFTWEYRFLSDGAPEEEDILSSVRAHVRKDTTALIAAPDPLLAEVQDVPERAHKKAHKAA